MQSLNSPINTSKYHLSPKKGGSARAEIIQQFVVKINEGRVNTKFKPVTGRQIAVKLSHMPERDLYPFLRECETARSFSAFFYYALNPARHGN